MLDWCRTGPPGAEVDGLTWEPVPVDMTLAGFFHSGREPDVSRKGATAPP